MIKFYTPKNSPAGSEIVLKDSTGAPVKATVIQSNPNGDMVCQLADNSKVWATSEKKHLEPDKKPAPDADDSAGDDPKGDDKPIAPPKPGSAK